MSTATAPPIIPQNANDVAFELLRLVRAMDRVTAELQDADEAAVRQRLTYDRHFSKAFVAVQGSIDMRKHLASLDTYEMHLAAELADVKVRNLRRKIESLRVQIDVGRSIGAAIRTEASTFGPGSHR